MGRRSVGLERKPLQRWIDRFDHLRSVSPQEEEKKPYEWASESHEFRFGSCPGELKLPPTSPRKIW